MFCSSRSNNTIRATNKIYIVFNVSSYFSAQETWDLKPQQ